MNSNPSQTPPELFVSAFAALLLAALLYTVNIPLSPFVIAGTVVFLLYPYRGSFLARRLMWIAIIFFVCWFVFSLLDLLIPFLIAFLLAYILNPVVTRLEKRRIPRWLGSLTLVLMLICLVVIATLFIGPVAFEQFQSIIAGVAYITRSAADFITTGRIYEVLAWLGIPMQEAQNLMLTQISPRLELILKTLFEGVFRFITGFSALVVHVISVVIIPFLVFYLLKDFPEIMHRVTRFVPAPRRDKFLEMARKADEVLGKYFRGAIIVAIIQGTLAGLGLWAIGVNYALTLGIMTGILDFIPYVGLIISLLVASLVASFSGEPALTKVVSVIILFLTLKLLEGTVLGPRIIGGGVGLHPVLLILCLMVFGYFLGFIGLLIAVPVTALLVAGFTEWETRRDSLVVAEKQ